MLRIGVAGQPDLTRATMIRADGKVALMLLGNVPVAGLTLPQVRQKLTERYSEYIVNAKVTVRRIIAID